MTSRRSFAARSAGVLLALVVALTAVHLVAAPPAKPAAAATPAAGTGPSAAPATPPKLATNWRAPATPVVQLLAQEATFVGDKPETETVLARWAGDDVKKWARSAVRGGVQFVSPPLPPAVGEAFRMRLVLRPGGATNIHVLPVLAVTQAKAVQKNIRGFDIPLPSGSDPAEAVTVESEVKETLRGNWADEADDTKLQRIEITLPGGSNAVAALDEVVFESEAALFAKDAASAAVVDRGGVLRPAFFAHAGAAVKVTVDVPAGRPALRWDDARMGDPGARVVSVVAGSSRTELARLEAGGAAGGNDWVPQAASLAKWAGRKVTLELATEDATSRVLGFATGKRRTGLGFFAVPRIVQEGVSATASTPDVVVYMVDMLRADRLGAWGSRIPQVSPNVDRLAREGVIFRNMISSSSWTKPAIPTLMTGLWETTHQVGSHSYTDKLPDGVPMIPERFRAGGWRTVSAAANPLGSTLSGLTRGFDAALPPRFWKGKVGPLGAPAADQLQDEVLAFIAEEPDQPVFAYIHTMEVHRFKEGMYAGPPAGMSEYDAAVQDADRKLGRLLEKLAAAKRGRDLLLILVADHGHSLMDHGKEGHGLSLFQSEVHIPLIFWSPNGRLPARAVERIAGLADVAPTLADLFGLPPLAGAQGTSLVPLLAGDTRNVHDFVPAALIKFVRFPDAPQQYAVVDPRLQKVIRVLGADTNLYDLAADPGEKRPIATAGKAQAPPLVGVLEGWMQAQKAAGAAFREKFGAASEVLDPEQVERLRSLGYVQ